MAARLGHGGVKVWYACVCEFPGPFFKFPMGGELCANLFMGVVRGSISKMLVDELLCVGLRACEIFTSEWLVCFVGELLADIPMEEGLTGPM